MRGIRNIIITSGAIASLGLATAASASATTPRPDGLHRCPGQYSLGSRAIGVSLHAEDITTNMSCEGGTNVARAVFTRELHDERCADAILGRGVCVVGSFRCKQVGHHDTGRNIPVVCGNYSDQAVGFVERITRF